MMNICYIEHRDEIVTLFNAHLGRLYGSQIAEWSVAYWSSITEQQLNMMKQLRNHQYAVELLFVSLVV